MILKICNVEPKRKQALLRSNLPGIGSPDGMLKEEQVQNNVSALYISEALCLRKTYAAYSIGVKSLSDSCGRTSL